MLEEKHNLTIQLQCTDAEAIQIIQAIKQTHPNCLPQHIDVTIRALQGNIKETFCKFFLGYYLSLNCLPMTTAYKMCKERFAEKGIHNIPTLNQMKYKLKKIPAAVIKLAREGRKNEGRKIPAAVIKLARERRKNEGKKMSFKNNS